LQDVPPTRPKERRLWIEDSIKKVEVGAKIAKETAEALEKIVSGVESVSNLVSDINEASNEQATAIAHINQGITQVSQVVQKKFSHIRGKRSRKRGTFKPG